MQAKAETSALSRRDFLTKGSAAALLTISASAVLCPSQGWGLEVKGLKPETMRTLIHMARDIYPHDTLGDGIYALALKSLDAVAVKDKATKTMLESGVKALDMAAKKSIGSNFIDVGWESQRLKLLRNIETGEFFQKIRSTLVTGIYNNKDVWAKLGYEGASAEKGGYLTRGFDDITWL